MSDAGGKRCNLLHRKSLGVILVAIEEDAEASQDERGGAHMLASVCIWSFIAESHGNTHNGNMDEASEEVMPRSETTPACNKPQWTCLGLCC